MGNFLDPGFFHAVLAVLLGSCTVVCLIGAGRSLGLLIGLGYTALIRVHPFRAVFDTTAAVSLCWVVWDSYQAHGRLDFSDLDITGFPLHLNLVESSAVAISIFGASLWHAHRHASMQPDRVSQAPITLKRSLFALSRNFIRERTFDEWIVSEIRCLFHFVFQSLISVPVEEISGRLPDVLDKSVHVARGRGLAERGRPLPDRGDVGAASSRWPFRPMGTIALLWCLALWMVPRWYTPLRSLANQIFIPGIALKAHPLDWYPAAQTGATGASHLTVLDVAVIAVAFLVAAFHSPPLTIRFLLALVAVAYLSIPLETFVSQDAVPLWTLVMPLPIAYTAAKLARVSESRIRTDAYTKSGRSARGWGRAGDHFSLVVALAIIMAVMSAGTDIWAADWSQEPYSKEFVTLLRDTVPLVVYLIITHVLTIMLTARRTSPFDHPAPKAIAVAAAVVIGPTIMYVSRFSVQASTVNGQIIVPDVYWYCGPVLAVAGFTIGTIHVLLAPGGRWSLPDAAHAEL